MLPWGSFNPQVLGAVPSSVVFMHFFQPSWLQPSTFAVDSRAKAHECSLTAGHSGCRLAVLPQRLRPHLSLMTPLAWCIHPGDCLQIPGLMMLLAWKHGLSKFSLASIPQSLGPLCSSTCMLQTYLCSCWFTRQCPLTSRFPFSGKFRRSLLSTTTTWLQCGAPIEIDWRHFQSSMQACSELDMLQSYIGRQL